MFSDSEGMVSEYPSKGRLAKGWLSWKETMENAVRSRALKCREHRNQWKTDTNAHLKVIIAFPRVRGKIPAFHNHNELNCLVVSACPSLWILLIRICHRLILPVFPHKKLVWNLALPLLSNCSTYSSIIWHQQSTVSLPGSQTPAPSEMSWPPCSTPCFSPCA